MPEMGTPRPNASPHISTSEWQSFEVRMRRRRFERCVLRAEQALAAGDEAGAAAALTEARELAPLETPDLDTLRARIAASLDPADVPLLREPEPETAGSSPRRAIAAAIILIGLLAAGYALSMRIDWLEDVPATVSLQPRSDVPAAAPPAAAPPEAPAVNVRQDFERAIPAAAPLASLSSAPETGPVPASYTPPPPSVGTAGGDDLPAVVGSAPSIAVAPPEPPPATPPAIKVAPLDAAGTPANALAGPPPAPPAPPAPEPVEPRIRAVLSTYEAAFGSLDASAVHSVWPTVDQRSLARAFDGLAAQTVSLGDCAISVRGETATARCQGSTTWAPKVGGGTRTEARRWEFALQNAGADWQIVRADVR